jgi:hypothetical protein
MADALFDLLSDAIMESVQPMRRADQPAVLDSLGLPPGNEDAETKAQYVRSRLDALSRERRSLAAVAERFAERFPVGGGHAKTFAIEELLWSSSPRVRINKRARRELGSALAALPICLDGARFLQLLSELFLVEEGVDLFAPYSAGRSMSLRARIERHVLRNPDDWNFETLFEELGAFDVSDQRFGRLLELLASADVRPDEHAQRAFVAVVNANLKPIAIELREVDENDGYPVFLLCGAAGVGGKPKTLIFATPSKPDIRFTDAVNIEIEIVPGTGLPPLEFDDAIPVDGLRWRHLQAWWSERFGVAFDEAKVPLYRRLERSIPETSPPQAFLFRSFFALFKAKVHDLPALLPEVWLHWDPKTVRERGRDALLNFRMDFLMLFSHGTRVVIEVDGKTHYADSAGRADASRYAALSAGDRDLRLSGYEVYRFGACELEGDAGVDLLRDFFSRLFTRHGESFG